MNLRQNHKIKDLPFESILKALNPWISGLPSGIGFISEGLAKVLSSNPAWLLFWIQNSLAIPIFFKDRDSGFSELTWTDFTEISVVAHPDLNCFFDLSPSLIKNSDQKLPKI